MNTQSDALPESRESVTVAPAEIPAPRRLYWALRRELWENRSIYIAPLIVAGVELLGFLVSTVGLPERRRAVLLLDPACL